MNEFLQAIDARKRMRRRVSGAGKTEREEASKFLAAWHFHGSTVGAALI
jgi:hypothetical protein